MKRNTLLAILLIVFFVMSSCATEPDGVPRKIKEYLDSYGWRMETFRKSDVSDLSGFRSHERWYLLDAPPDEVWSYYTEFNPDDQWDGPIAHFGLLYEPGTSAIHTPASEELPKVEVGDILFLDLLIEAFLHIPTAFQISRLDEEAKVIEFTYLEQNTSHGCQELTFYPISGEDKTLIRHRSWFSSGSKVRDALFYRPYHTQTVDEFHWSVAERSGLDIDAMNLRELKRKELFPGEQPLDSGAKAVSFD